VVSLDKDLREALFAIYSAGFEAGYSQKIDISTAFKEYLNILQRQLTTIK
jgi:hypothetical protein